VAQEFIAGETLHSLAKRHDISRNLIRIWVAKYEAGEFNDDAEAADMLQAYEAKVAALERLVGRQALEIEFRRGPLRSAPPRSVRPAFQPRSATRCSRPTVRSASAR
jgi:transposase